MEPSENGNAGPRPAETGKATGADAGRRSRLDLFIRALPAAITATAVIWAGFLAEDYKVRSTAVTLLSQREQAESALRAKMFSDLIRPIVGADANVAKVEREQLLVELLALNFHEHFEFKPLVQHVTRRIDLEHPNDPAKAKEMRGSLKSIMGRVAARQINALLRTSGDDTPKDRATFELKTVFTEFIEDSGAAVVNDPPGGADACADEQTPAANAADVEPALRCDERGCKFGAPIVSTSPEGTREAYVYITEPDWAEETVKVTLLVQSATPYDEAECDSDDATGGREVAEEYDEPVSTVFTLTWYDLPFTDHMLLADGTRFALILRSMDREQKSAEIGFLWFPKDFFTPRERPIKYGEFRRNLGLGGGD